MGGGREPKSKDLYIQGKNNTTFKFSMKCLKLLPSPVLSRQRFISKRIVRLNFLYAANFFLKKIQESRAMDKREPKEVIQIRFTNVWNILIFLHNT